MGSIDIAYNWMIQTCNTPNIGYSQAYRQGQTINGITYYDCSSIISKSLTVGGFYENNPWFTTNTMVNDLRNLGFNVYPTSIEWVAGDILLNVTQGHTEMCYSGNGANGGGVTMGAHTDTLPLSEQVSINTYVTSPDYYEYVLRYGSGVIPLKWIEGNRYLNDDEMKNNAYVFFQTMLAKGFSMNAIAGMLGNIESESSINPGIWQDLQMGNYSVGFGLVQWTPATNYTFWALNNGYDITDGYGQCKWIDTETDKGQWIETENYMISWEEFKTSVESPEYLASAFLKNFERAGVEVEETRRQQARKWYEYLKDFKPIKPPHIFRRKRMPLWFYLHPF